MNAPRWNAGPGTGAGAGPGQHTLSPLPEPRAEVTGHPDVSVARRAQLQQLLRVPPQRRGRRSVRQHVHEGGGEEAATVGVRLEDSLHPVLVLGLLGEDDDHVALLERKLVLVVRLAVVQRAASPVAVEVVSLKTQRKN